MSVVTIKLAKDGVESLNGIFDLAKNSALKHDDEEIVGFIDECRDELCEPENEVDLSWEEISVLLQILAYLEPRFSVTEYNDLLHFARQFRTSIESAANEAFNKTFGQNKWQEVDFDRRL